jgi:hypothetical protein
VTDDRGDARLDAGPPALRLVLQERLLLREAEGDDRAVDRDGPELTMSGFVGGCGAQLLDDRGQAASRLARAASRSSGMRPGGGAHGATAAGS